jgi:hypothetical protein
MNEYIALYKMDRLRELIDRIQEMYAYEEVQMSDDDLATLSSLTFDQIDELETMFASSGSCVGSCILLTHGASEFFRIMDHLRATVSRDVFRWIIDYNMELSEADGNPLDFGIFTLAEYFLAIQKYYESRYHLIYKPRGRYPSYARHLISKDKNAKQEILNELSKYPYNAAAFDASALDDIYNEYY